MSNCRIAVLENVVVLLDRSGHHRGHITPPTSTHPRTHSPDTHTYTEFLLSHGSLVDAQSGCCQSELNLHQLAAFLLTLPASGWVFNILFRIPLLSPHGYIR